MTSLRSIASAVLAGAALCLAACGPAAPGHDDHDVDGPEPDVEPVAQVSSSLTVAGAVNSGCSTTMVKGLSEQIVAQMSCIVPQALVAVPERPNLQRGAATFAYMQPPARDALVAALDANPSKTLGVNSMLRTVAQQYLLYRWSLTKSCGVALAAKPGRSNHEWGLAIDTSQYASWQSALESRGYDWFGSSDRVHFDYRGSGKRDLAGVSVKAFQMLWNANHPNDEIPADGKYGSATEARLAKAPATGFAIGSTCASPAPAPAPSPSPDPEPATEGRALGVIWDLSTGASPSAPGALLLFDAVVSVEGGPSTSVRASDAFWELALAPGRHRVHASATGYTTATREIDVVSSKDTWASIGLQPAATPSTFTVAVTGPGGAGLSGAIVHAPGAGAWRTGSTGRLELQATGSVTVEAYAEGHEGRTVTLDATGGGERVIRLSAAVPPSSPARLQGVVWDASKASSATTSAGARLPGTFALCSCGRATTARAGDAYFALDVPAGTHTVTFLHDGFVTVGSTRTFAKGASEWGSLGLTPR